MLVLFIRFNGFDVYQTINNRIRVVKMWIARKQLWSGKMYGNAPALFAGNFGILGVIEALSSELDNKSLPPWAVQPCGLQNRAKG